MDQQVQMRGEEEGKRRVSLGNNKSTLRLEKATSAPKRRQRLTTSTPPPPPRRVRLKGNEKEEGEEKVEGDLGEGENFAENPAYQYQWEYYYDYEYE